MSWTVHKKGVPGKQSFVAVAVGDKVYTMSPRPVDDRIEVRVFHTLYLRWMKCPPVTTGGGKCPLEAIPTRPYNPVLIDNCIYIWGGHPHCNVLYAFDVDTHGWFKPDVSGTCPDARTRHSACVLGKVMYIYGGLTQWLKHTNCIYKLDTATMVWSLINTRGTPSAFSADHSATIIGTKMFVFEGRGIWDYHYGIRVFDTETYSWRSIYGQNRPGPTTRCHSPFAHNGELYIFGGHSLGRTMNDLWKFNPETLLWKKVEPRGKGPCRISTVSCCTVGDRVVLFGGNRHKSDHLYILDLSPSLKTLCKLAVIQHGLEQAGLPHNIRWELEAMTSNRKRKYGLTL